MRQVIILTILVAHGWAQPPVKREINIANDSSTGTTLNTLTKLTGSPSSAVLASTSDTGGMVGIASAGAGTTGIATVTTSGRVSCVFDGATAAGDYIQISSVTAGNCHDAGAAYPGSGQVIGRALSTNASGGTYTIDLFPAEIQAQTATATTVSHAVGYVFDGGGSPLTAGAVGYLTVPFACTLQAWNITADTGTATIKVWKVASGTAIPTASNSINTAGVGISSGTAVHSTTLSDFSTTSITKNDLLGIDLFAVSGATKVSFVLECQ